MIHVLIIEHTIAMCVDEFSVAQPIENRISKSKQAGVRITNS